MPIIEKIDVCGLLKSTKLYGFNDEGLKVIKDPFKK